MKSITQQLKFFCAAAIICCLFACSKDNDEQIKGQMKSFSLLIPAVLDYTKRPDDLLPSKTGQSMIITEKYGEYAKLFCEKNDLAFRFDGSRLIIYSYRMKQMKVIKISDEVYSYVVQMENEKNKKVVQIEGEFKYSK